MNQLDKEKSILRLFYTQCRFENYTTNNQIVKACLTITTCPLTSSGICDQTTVHKIH